MNKRCFLVGRKDSLFKQLVASLLVDMMDNLDLYENKAVEFDALLEEIKFASPHLLLLEEASPFSENSLTTRFLASLPALPVVVISEDSNLIYVVRCNARLLSSSRDLIEAIHLTFDHHFNPNKENVL